MATPAEKLADALDKLQAAQRDGIVRSENLTRTYLTRLVKAGFLQEILRGWYYVTQPTGTSGDAAWYGHYWNFIQHYLTERLGEAYCLLPESSLLLHTGSTVVPRQLSVMRPTPGQQVISLCLDTSLFIYQERSKFPERIVLKDGLRVMELGEALIRVHESFFRDHAEEAIIALRLVHDPTLLLSNLLENGQSVVAGRLAGAFRQIGEDSTADRILKTMKNAGYDVRERNPFDKPPLPSSRSLRSVSPYVSRIEGMWSAMRPVIIETFPPTPGRPANPEDYLAQVEEKYVQDAYHSLSIEGYRVSPALIEKIRSGAWDPRTDSSDGETRDALAARGYLEAFREVKASVGEILQGKEAAEIVRTAHHDWYGALFAPSVGAGLLSPAALAGYRQGPVFIRGSRHVPLPEHSLADAMEALFDLLLEETHPAVRAVLGHFVFVFIHPYSDGNGRMGRFLMNAMLGSGGYPWTIIHLENRTRYMEALEQASVNRNIRPFAECLLGEMLLREPGASTDP